MSQRLIGVYVRLRSRFVHAIIQIVNYDAYYSRRQNLQLTVHAQRYPLAQGPMPPQI